MSIIFYIYQVVSFYDTYTQSIQQIKSLQTTDNQSDGDSNPNNNEVAQDQVTTIKKPLTPYFMFAAEHKEETKSLSLGERGKFIGVLWSKLTDAEKQVYKDRYSQQLQEYNALNINVKKPSKVKAQHDGELMFIYSHHLKFLSKYNEKLTNSLSVKNQLSKMWSTKSSDEQEKWKAAFMDCDSQLQKKIQAFE
ncbi:HMG_(High mobility group) box domain-containing protein [Hexamita inflata]|uniref:HMG (High mobility group) box domain-containing protein n=1 Tax=Hexamita inflata TaxID=28002 RepID=A0AA86QDD3_9EUKA|nr:HMG (High mobility group) box domain-containing protein [Hexamita inflata]